MLKNIIQKFIPSPYKETLFIRFWSYFNVPLLYKVSPKVLEVGPNGSKILIPLKSISKNHLNSMYFGALSIGADCAGGMYAFYRINNENLPISLVFKNFEAKFLRRPEDDVVFECTESHKVDNLIEKCIKEKGRFHDVVNVKAYCPSKLGEEVVAEFKLTLSLKSR